MLFLLILHPICVKVYSLVCSSPYYNMETDWCTFFWFFITWYWVVRLIHSASLNVFFYYFKFWHRGSTKNGGKQRFFFLKKYKKRKIWPEINISNPSKHCRINQVIEIFIQLMCREKISFYAFVTLTVHNSVQ